MLFNDGGAYETSMGTWSRLVGEVFIKWLRADGKPEGGDGRFACSGLVLGVCVGNSCRHATQGGDDNYPVQSSVSSLRK